MRIRTILSLALLAAALAVAVPREARAAYIFVDSLADDGVGCTLRNAILSANTNVAVGTCDAGSGDDFIKFSVTGTITLADVIMVTEAVHILPPTSSPPATNLVTVKSAEGKRIFFFNSPGNNQSFYLYSLNLVGNAPQEGGGIALSTGDSLVVSGCVIKRCNSGAGGGVFNFGGDLAIYNSSIAGNGTSAVGNYGGGIYTVNGLLYLSSCFITGNYAALQGAGLYSEGSAVTIDHCTFAGNRASNSGGGAFLKGTVAKTITNSIFSGNAAPIAPQVGSTGTSPTVSYTDNAGTWVGPGNIKANPRFISRKAASAAPTAEGNYHLRDASPCIDAATFTPSSRDIDGDYFGQDGTADMGADEAGPPYNDSFEYGTAVPSPWVGSNLAAGDGRVLGGAHRGRYSFRISGSAANKSLRQVLPLSGTPVAAEGGPGIGIQLTGWSKTSGSSAGGQYRLEAKIHFDDGTHKLIAVDFASGTHGWAYNTGGTTVLKPYNKIVLTLRYAGQTGTAWFDDVKVRIQ